MYYIDAVFPYKNMVALVDWSAFQKLNDLEGLTRRRYYGDYNDRNALTAINIALRTRQEVPSVWRAAVGEGARSMGESASQPFITYYRLARRRPIHDLYGRSALGQAEELGRGYYYVSLGLQGTAGAISVGILGTKTATYVSDQPEVALQVLNLIVQLALEQGHPFPDKPDLPPPPRPLPTEPVDP